MKKIFAAMAFVAAVCQAQSITGKWSGIAETVDASGVKRTMRQTIRIDGEGTGMTGLLVGSKGRGIPLRVIQEGNKFTLLGDLDFEGGEHLRWYFELKDGRLNGKVWAVHDSPKKWGVDWTGPVELARAE